MMNGERSPEGGDPENKDPTDNTVSNGGVPPQMSSRQLFMMSVASAVVYLALALLIFYYFHGTGVGEVFERGYSVSNQLIIGILSGIAASAVIGFISSRPPVSEVLYDFYIVELLSKMQLTTFDRIQLSLFAGAGEELLFRGAIQPLLGNSLTSLIFIGIHGYFKFKSIGHILFGVMMFGLSFWLGYLFEQAGLIAAMSAHASYDIIMLHFVKGRDR